MINWVIAAFEENESLLRRYREKYLYIWSMNSGYEPEHK
jgi:hypothetical protein